MNHHRPCAGRPALRASSTILKWILIAVFILFLGLQTIPSSTNLVQREETTLGQHRTTHHLDAGPTSSPLTKAMKVLLHHLPARRSESAGQVTPQVLTLGPNDLQQREKYHGCSNYLSRHDREAYANSKVDFIDSPNARELHDATLSRIEREGHEVVRDLIGHDNTGHLCSTMECFCKSTGRCERESIRDNITYKRPGRKGNNQRAMTRSSVERDVSQHASRREDNEGQEIPYNPCRCGQDPEKCPCSDDTHHSAERPHLAKGTERIGNNAIVHFRPSDPSSKIEDYQSNERGATDVHSEKKSFQQDSDSPQPVYKHDTPDARSTACHCNEQHRGCHCNESAQLELLADKTGDASALPNVEKRMTPRQYYAPTWAGHTKNGHCTCGSCTSLRNWVYDSLYGGRGRSRDLAKSHNLFEGENGSAASPADTCNTLLNEGGNFTDSVHLAEVKNRRGSRTETPRPVASEINTAENRFQSKWQFDRASLNLPQSLDTHSISKTSAALDSRQRCRKFWRRNTSCLPRHRATPVAKAIQYLLRRDSTFLDSITEANCGSKVGAEKEQCEQNHRTGLWILCSVLAVAGTCGLLLGVLVLHLHFKRKKPSPLLISRQPVHKSVPSSPISFVGEIQKPRVGRTFGMRRIEENEIDETGSVRRYTTLDGATDGWTRWINKQKHGVKVSQRKS